jgi:CBS domain-containing protein
MPAAEAQAWLRAGGAGAGHRVFPLLEADGRFAGLLSRSRLVEAEPSASLRSLARASTVDIHPDCTLREAAERMAAARVDALMVMDPADPARLLGLLTLRDLLQAHGEHLEASAKREAFEILPSTQVFRAD